ncbi:MAG: hypothetical protein ABFD16_08525, partial [Thermoguttaceae bacterium]
DLSLSCQARSDAVDEENRGVADTIVLGSRIGPECVGRSEPAAPAAKGRSRGRKPTGRNAPRTSPTAQR